MVKMGFLTVKDVVDDLGISPGTLKNWEAAGKIPKARRHPMNRYRVYTQEDVAKIKKLLKA